MDRALVTNNDDRVKLVAYADDLAVLIAGSDLGEIQGKARATLGALRDWATLRGLTFSASKSQAIPLKGGLRPGFSVPFRADEIVAVSSVRYLGVELDSRRNFWAHVSIVAGKSETLYSRLRAASSANWGLQQSTSAVLAPCSPTYWPSHGNRHLDTLDFFLTNLPNHFSTEAVNLNDPASDHSPVLLFIGAQPSVKQNRPTITPGTTN
ncbi:hypothetical protein QTP88_026124 [Uroleucon formosanum]